MLGTFFAPLAIRIISMLLQKSLFAVLIAIAAAAFGLGSSAGAQTVADIQKRDQLIATQEALLNAYRCQLNVDVAAVMGGCANGMPILSPADPGTFSGTPTQNDIDVREKLIAEQEDLLNSLRCRFGVDTDAVSGVCPEPDEQPVSDEQPEPQGVQQPTPAPIPTNTEPDPGASPQGQEPQPFPWVGQLCVKIEEYGEDSDGWVYNDPDRTTCTMFENIEYIINNASSRAALHYVNAYGSRVLLCPHNWKIDEQGLCRYPNPEEAALRNAQWRQRYGEGRISIEFPSDASSQSAVFIPIQLIVLTSTP